MIMMTEKIFLFIAVQSLTILLLTSTRSQAQNNTNQCPEDRCPLALNPILCVNIDALKCNGRVECMDGEDEVDCENTECLPDQFKCGTICLSVLLRCNGQIDCESGEDEDGCDAYECDTSRTKCESDPVCVPKFDVCDGRYDCEDRSDEQECFGCDDFLQYCDDLNSECIASSQYCDGVIDCRSKSDESMCSKIQCTESPVLVKAPARECIKTSLNTLPSENQRFCDIGFAGKYCNETCTSCKHPSCTENDLIVNFFTISGPFRSQENVCTPPNVEKLHLKDMKISEIHEDILQAVEEQIEYLRISNVAYDCLDRNFIQRVNFRLNFLYLNHMNFAQNSLPYVHNLQNLILVNLNHNTIEALDVNVFKGSYSLLRISISHNYLENIPAGLFEDQRDTLRELYLSFNRLKGNLQFFGLRDLVLLDLSHNCIEVLPEDVFIDLRSLDRLYLQGNSLIAIPFLKGVSLKSLESLEIYTSNVGCSSVETKNEIMCKNVTQGNDRYQTLSIRLSPGINHCENVASCNCSSFIGGYECQVEDEGNCQPCGGLINIDPRCLTRPSEELACSLSCNCTNDGSFFCKDERIKINVIQPDRLCIWKNTTKLTFDNIDITSISFDRLLQFIGDVSELRFRNMNVTRILGKKSTDLYLAKIRVIHISYNLKTWPTFLHVLPNLAELSFAYNELTEIPENAFSNNLKLRKIYLNDNKINNVSQNAFAGLDQLEVLDISHNALAALETTLHHNIFVPLPSLRVLNISGNEVRRYSASLFSGQSVLAEVHGDYFTICCLAQLVNQSVICSPFDVISSCDQLIADDTLKVLIWIQAHVTAIGNMFVIFLRVREYNKINRVLQHKTAKINIFLIGLLALSDLLMCFYLFIIASADQFFSGNYYENANDWLDSRLCSAAGVLAMLSAESSVFTLTLITITRLLSIVQPFNYLAVNVKRFHIAAILIWLVAFLLACIPLMGFESLNDFFSSSGTCLPSLYVSTSDLDWQYTTFLLTINLLLFTVMLISYTIIIVIARNNDQRAKRLNISKSASRMNAASVKLSTRVAVIVFTDMLCWMPICIFGLISLTHGGLQADVHRIIYPVTAIILLPINSTINPVIYTLITSTVVSRRLKAVVNCFNTELKTSSSPNSTTAQSNAGNEENNKDRKSTSIFMLSSGGGQGTTSTN